MRDGLRLKGVLCLSEASASGNRDGIHDIYDDGNRRAVAQDGGHALLEC